MSDPTIPDPMTGSAAGSNANPARWSGSTTRRPSPTIEIPSPPTTTPEPTTWLRRHRRSLIVWAVVVAAIAFRLMSSGSSGPDFTALKVGDCLDLPEATTVTKLTTVECAKPHTREVYAIGDTAVIMTLTNSAQDLADPELVRVCRTDVAPAILSAVANAADAQAGYLISSKRTDRVVCVVVTAIRTGSLVAAIKGP